MQPIFLPSRRVAATAALSALLGLAACQNQDSSSVPSAPPVTEGPSLESPDVPRMVQGRKATDEELARFLAANPNILDWVSDGGTNPLPKASADTLYPPTACNVNFNDSWALEAVPDQAHKGYSKAPHYKHNCFFKYSVNTQPINTVYIRLTPETPSWCSGPSPLIGTWGTTACVNQTPGKYWPRTAGNMGGNTGVNITVSTTSPGIKDFDLKSIKVHSGDAELEGFRPGIGLWIWYFPPGTWIFPNVRLSFLNVYARGRNGQVHFDNLNLAIHL